MEVHTSASWQLHVQDVYLINIYLYIAPIFPSTNKHYGAL